MMKKLILSAAAAAVLAGSAYTMTATAAPDAPGARAERAMTDRGFLFDARLAGMKAELKLNPEQEKAWAPFESAVREAAKARREAMREQRETRDGAEGAVSPIDRMERMSDRLAKASQQVKQIAEAAKPLYNSLDDGQKREFGPLLHMLRGAGGGHGGWRHERG